MTQPTHTLDTFDAQGLQDELAEAVYSIAPVETPFCSLIKKGVCKTTRPEWQTDTLNDPDLANAKVEGADAVLNAIQPTVRVGNRTQISDKTLVVSGTLEATDKAGRKSELGYQISKLGRELKRDIEAIITSQQGSDAGSSTTPRRLGAVGAWLVTNSDRGDGGADGGFDAASGEVLAPTAGTARQFTEDMLRQAMQDAYTAGGAPSKALMSPTLKRRFASFAGIAEHRVSVPNTGEQEAAIIASADVYLSDFGRLEVVPDRFSPIDACYLIDPDYLQICHLSGREMVQRSLGVTGDNEKRQMTTEYSLRVFNEAAHAVIAEITG